MYMLETKNNKYEIDFVREYTVLKEIMPHHVAAGLNGKFLQNIQSQTEIQDIKKPEFLPRTY